MSRNRLWMHCTAVGICSQLISKRILSTDGEDAFLAGILHDLGMIIEEQTRKLQFRQIVRNYKKSISSLTECENEILNTNHCLIGEYVARKWNFPDDVRKAMIEHHDAYNGDNNLNEPVEIVKVAHFLVEHIGYTEIP